MGKTIAAYTLNQDEKPMKILVIVNSKSKYGTYRNLESIIRRKFTSHQPEIIYTQYPGHATEIAFESTQKKIDTIIAVGGDGTVNEVLNGIVNRDVALGIIPSGTANDLASLYKIPSNVESACETILERHVHQTDVITVNGWHYVTAGGLGLSSEVACRANKLKQNSVGWKLLGKILGSKIYILAVLLILLRHIKRHQYLLIKCNGYSHIMDTLSLMVNNQPFLGKNFWMSPRATNDDGLFDICWIENSRTRVEVLLILLQVLKGKHVALPSVHTWQAEELLVQSKEPLTFFGDGEKFQEDTQFHLKILPKELSILVPLIKERSVEC